MADKILQYLALIFFLSIIFSILYTIWADLETGLRAVGSSVVLFIAQYILSKELNKLGKK